MSSLLSIIRKKGKLPGKTMEYKYELEYGQVKPID